MKAATRLSVSAFPRNRLEQSHEFHETAPARIEHWSHPYGMPQVGYDIHRHRIRVCEETLFNFDHSLSDFWAWL
jgi:hypothetical protein